MITLDIDLAERTVSGTSKDDPIRYRSYGLLWSRGRGCWVWAKTTTPEQVKLRAWQLSELAKSDENLTVNVTGEAATIDQDADERNERIAERHDRRAAAERAEATARLGSARTFYDNLPLGQPIITGRGSRTTADINRRNRAHINEGKGHDAARRASESERLADAARGRINARETFASAERCPPELIAAGDVITELYKDGRRHRYHVLRVNSKTITWSQSGCSGKIDLSRIVGCDRPGVGQIWPIATTAETNEEVAS